jgi:glycosyltransferase involved in cell wall biosynthesis
MLTFFYVLNAIKADVYVQRTLTAFSGIIAQYVTLIMKKKFIYMVAHDMDADGTHAIYKRPLLGYISKKTFKHAAYVIVQNEYEQKFISRAYPNTHCKILKKPIDASLFELKHKKRYDAIWVGRCDDWKRPEAFLDLCERHPQQLFIMIAPPATDKNSYFETIKNRADKIKNLTFEAYVSNSLIREKLAVSRVFCITSTMEGDWPMVVLEAAASGLPIVSLQLNYSGLIDEFRGGVHCKGDLNTFFHEFNSLLSDENKIRRLGNGARKYISVYHDLNTQMEKFKKIIRVEI